MLLGVAGGQALAQGGEPLPEWPLVTREAKPWTRWWWHGSAVNEEELTDELDAFRQAGIGGVEITPIYSVESSVHPSIEYLTPRWLEVFTHTLREAERMDLGVDMATGNGWPFGGPWVGAEDASKYVAFRSYELRGGEMLAEPIAFQQAALVRAIGNSIGAPIPTGGVPGDGGIRIRIEALRDPVASNPDLQALALEQVRFPKPLPLQVLMAYSSGGEALELTDRVDASGRLEWQAPSGSDWRLYALFQGWHGKLVERAGPGGEGEVIDHFSRDALSNYLGRFDQAFAGQEIGSLRAFFNDSYEVDDASGEANWTPRFLEEFRSRRGYDLRFHLPALFGQDTPERGERVLTDYRQTISDLILEGFTDEWRRWARQHGAIIRNQAHGSPANVLDLYGASDIPETEGTGIQRIKFGSSAAHVMGKPLTSAEAATWLNEHFVSSLADVRRTAERFLLGGVNQVVYHGSAYSPRSEAWPGWLFYAAVHFNPQNSWWTDFAALNRYIGNTQAFLQAGEPDNDLLLYFPISDYYAERTGEDLLVHFSNGTARARPGPDTPFSQVADSLWTRGYAYDFISDRQLLATHKAAGGLRAPGGLDYRAVLIPETRYIPLESLEKLVELARSGGTILVHRTLPAHVAGMADLDRRSAHFRQLLTQLDFGAPSGEGVREARIGAGRILIGADLGGLLARAGVRREELVERGLQFVRRRNADGATYFIANWGEEAVEGWVSLGTSAAAAALFDPMMERRGYAQVRVAGPERVEVYLQVGAGETRVVRTYNAARSGDAFPHHRASGPSQELQGAWSLTFTKGAPELPAPQQLDRLRSWTELPGTAVKSFSGTGVYQTSFARPETGAEGYLLDLGVVHQSARVRLNEEDLGTLIGPRYQLVIPGRLVREANVLEVRVSNLMANRIADLDRREVPWKKFYNLNMSGRLPENRGEDALFSAARWDPLPSGLVGPVTLTPVEIF